MSSDVLSLITEIEEKFGLPRLTVEMVPRDSWFKSVKDLLAPEDWDRLRKPTYREAHHVCKVCGGRGPKWPVECHEIWQYDDLNHIQKLLGLIALCPDCHRVKHMGRAVSDGEGDLARAHLMKINGWTSVQAQEYLRVVGDIWRKRSVHQWEIDYSWLEQFGISIERRH